MSKAFGENLRFYRKQWRMSQEDFAKQLRISRSALNMYERGEREPTFEILCEMANRLGTTVSELITEKTYTVVQDRHRAELLWLYDNAESDYVRKLAYDVLKEHQRSDQNG